jgi:hypothetical protein
LAAVIDQPKVLEQIRQTLKLGDVEGFSTAVLGNWREFDIVPPADKCDPYVTVYVEVISPPTYVQECHWVFREAPAGTIRYDGAIAGLKADLIARGFLECKWVRQDPDTVLVVKKFVQGICPPGTF